MRKILLLILLGCMVFTTISCAWFRRPLDKMSGFSGHLKEVEHSIRNEQWKDASVDLKKAIKSWYKVKPFLQVDIDHDYVNDIEDDFVRLRGSIDTGQKSDSLTTILLIEENWRNIGSM